MAENTSTIPDHIWEIIPEKGQYLRHIMDRFGYTDPDDVIVLKDPEELKNMLRLAGEIAPTIKNKTEFYGQFDKNPEKVRMLPGILPAFHKFLGEVDKLRSEKPSEFSSGSSKKSNRKRSTSTVSIEDIQSQIQSRLEDKGINRRFRLTISPTNLSNCTYTCLHCQWKSNIVVHKDIACLDSIINHITNHCNVTGNATNISNSESEIPDGSQWSSRGYRGQRKLLKVSSKPGQTKITEYFDIEQFSSEIDDIIYIRKKVNETIGEGENVSVKPILKLLYSNALKNASKNSKNACRHERSIKMFGAYLFSLIGRAGCEFLLENLGAALPSLPTIMRMINEFPRIKEGEFLFDELVKHLKKWKAPMFIHVQMDDIRVLNKVDYDYGSDRFVGFVLPVHKGIPVGDAFILSTFDELKNVYENTSVASYAHCIVAKPLSNDAPSFVFFVLGTDSKYDHTVILERWNHIELELKKRGITIVSFGADGAGSFMKAMLQKTGLFFPTKDLFSKSYVMKEVANSGLSAQDHIHLLAKLKTRLVTPSNIIALGDETACLGHLKYILETYSKEAHQLTEGIISNKDKQNYSGIEILLSDGVMECLRNFGTMTYLGLMRDVRDSFLDKSLKRSTRLLKIWKVVFFCRLWRRWLKDHGRPEKDHFITTNPTYTVATSSKGTVHSKTYTLHKGSKTPFILYNDRYIRKTTALYLLQENVSLSNDRLLRVRQTQLSHIHNTRNNSVYPENHLKTCDLCLFRRVDDLSKFAVGRVLQFSYMHGSKKGREFSSDYVDFDTSKTELSEMGAFCNWYIGEEVGDFIGFKLTHDYTQGYLSLDNYFMKIAENESTRSENYGFCITKEYFLKFIDNIVKVIG